MHAIHFTIEDLGMEQVRYIDVALAVVDLFDSEPVGARAIGERFGRTRRQIAANIRAARKHGLLELRGKAMNSGYVPTEKLRKLKDEYDKRRCPPESCSLGNRIGGATGAA